MKLRMSGAYGYCGGTQCVVCALRGGYRTRYARELVSAIRIPPGPIGPSGHDRGQAVWRGKEEAQSRGSTEVYEPAGREGSTDGFPSCFAGRPRIELGSRLLRWRTRWAGFRSRWVASEADLVVSGPKHRSWRASTYGLRIPFLLWLKDRG